MILKKIIILALTLFLTACGASKFLAEPSSDKVSLVFGYIDMSDAPTELTWIRTRRIRPDYSEERGAAVLDGMFYNTWQTPGSYKFLSFGGYFNNGMTRYVNQMPAQGRSKLDAVIKKPGVHYLGSYKYVRTPDNSFELVAVKQPTEKQLLLKLKEYSKIPYWTTIIDKRLKRL